jgi:glycosyltransferase involved in cell wall biosynthesis
VGGLENGGAEAILTQLLLATNNDSRVNQYLVVLDEMSPAAKVLVGQGVSVSCFDLRQKNEGRWSCRQIARVRGMLRLLGFFVEFRPDLVHSWLYFPDLIAAPFAKLVRAKLVWGIFLSDLSRRYYRNSTWFAMRVCGRLAGIVPDKIVSCTLRGAETHIAIGYPRKKTELIYPGVDVGKFRANQKARSIIRERFNVGDNSIVIGMVARWDPQKNHRVFFEAIQKLRSRYSDINVWLCGGRGITEKNSELMSLVEECGLKDIVHLLGCVDDLVEFYSGLDVFTLVSKGEGFPLVLLEAMSCELACVANNVGDVANLMRSSQGLVKDVQPNQLCEMWGSLIDMGKSKRQAIGSANRELVVKDFSSDLMVSKYLNLYADM